MNSKYIVLGNQLLKYFKKVKQDQLVEFLTMLTIILINVITSIIVLFFYNTNTVSIMAQTVNMLVTLFILFSVYRFGINKILLSLTVIYYYIMSVGMWAGLSFGNHLPVIYSMYILMITIILLRGKLRKVLISMQVMGFLLLSYIDLTYRADKVMAISFNERTILNVSVISVGMILVLSIHIFAFRDTNRFLASAARTDVLTGIGNRFAMYEKVEHFEKLKDVKYTVVFIDINDSKLINDQYGHDIGDIVLKDFAKLLKKNIRESDSLYRSGGDEFVIVFNNMDMSSTKLRMEQICDNLKSERILNLCLKFSYGISNDDFGNQMGDGKIMTADHMMYKAKKEYKSGNLVAQNIQFGGIGTIG